LLPTPAEHATVMDLRAAFAITPIEDRQYRRLSAAWPADIGNDKGQQGAPPATGC